MSGYPRAPTRAMFGPSYTNTKPVRDPQRQADAGVFNLAFDTLAGAGLMVPRAWALVHGTSGGATLVANAEAWNPDQETSAPFTPPAVARTSAGIYTLTYSANYPDSEGNSVALGILATYARPVNTSSVRVALATFATTVLTVNLKQQDDGGGAWALVDGDFLAYLI